ncbi:MAG TPA: Hsp20/alpha crystallin family protein [Polyangiaceae bacterium]|nr:Hsp20/alpha crystallin family protein [Polyangiaceae bacterium]
MWNMFDPFPMFDRVFDDVMRSALGTATAAQNYSPAVDVRADDDKVVFHCDLPGVRRDDLSLTLENGVLTIKGERKYRAGSGQEKVWLGRSYGAFSRSFSLPEGLDEQGLSAELADGVLTITVPKHPKAKPRRIEIRGGSSPRQLESGEGNGNGQQGG